MPPSLSKRWILLATLLFAVGVPTTLVYRNQNREQPGPAVPRVSVDLSGAIDPRELNVVLITIDTLRADRLGCYGADRIETPAIDRLAREGIRFSNAATTVPFTLPAHSSIMTGTYPPYHGVRENVGYVLSERLPTLASVLATGGWQTAGFVSAFVLDSRWGIDRGFDRYFDEFDPTEMETPNLASVQREGRETIAEAITWLDSRPSGRFFLWLHLFEPHDPYTPPEPFRSLYLDRPYDGEVAYADQLIADFRSQLEARGLLDTSLLVLTGDHGEGLGQHKEQSHGFFVYESTVHVPLIIRPPTRVFDGTVVDAAVSHVDLAPTILETVGLPIPESAQGRSLAALIGTDPNTQGERWVYSESLYPFLHYGWAPSRSLRGPRFKFIDTPEPELYDIVDDPLEERNLLLEDRRLSRQMKGELDRLRVQIDNPGGSPEHQPDIDEATLGQLEALGYLAGRGSVELEAEDDRPRADPKQRIELHHLIMTAQNDIGRDQDDAARQKLLGALETDDTIVEAHQMLGTLANQQGRFDEAIPYFRRALELDVADTASIFGLATAYRELGRRDEALIGFRRVLEISPNDARAAIATVDLLFELDRVDDAISVLEPIADQSNASAVLQNQLGELYFEAGQIDDATYRFHQAVARAPDFAQPRFNLAVLTEEAGDLQGAAEWYEEAIEISPKHYQALFNLSRIEASRGDPERERQLLEASVAANPNFVRGYYYLAKSIMDSAGDLDYAETLVRKGLSLDSDSEAGPLGYFLLADILNRLGRPSEAQQAVERARSVQAQSG